MLFHYYDFDVPTLKYASSFGDHSDNPLQRLRDNARFFGGAILRVVQGFGEPDDEMYLPLKITIEGDIVRPEAPMLLPRGIGSIGQEDQTVEPEQAQQQQPEVNCKEQIAQAKQQTITPVEAVSDRDTIVSRLVKQYVVTDGA